MPSFVDEPATDTYYYSDGYFTALSTQQNQHLLTMSMALALASMEIGGDSYITALLNDIGYTDIQTDDMTVTPTKDTIGTAIAHYDGYYRSYTEYFEELNLYHFATLFVNREAILIQHYPQTNWALVKATDSNYSKGIILGDADGDGTVTILDATYIQRRLARLSVPNTFNEKAACVGGGETLDITDATFIQRFLASLQCPDGIGKTI
jgi:hypothetical protein